MAYVTDIRFGGTTLADRFASLRSSMADRRERRRMYTQTFKELNALTPRELADIGIAKSDIKRIAMEAANV